MQIQRKSFIKWTVITLACGAHSFFWGFVNKSSIGAMLLGLVTLILMFSVIESHPFYQAKRAAHGALARALDWGIKIRVGLALYIPLSFVLLGIGNPIKNLTVFFYPYLGEIFIGLGAIRICGFLTGIDITNHGELGSPIGAFNHFAATYVTTLITGLIHTAILALICGVVYIFIKLKKQRT